MDFQPNEAIFNDSVTEDFLSGIPGIFNGDDGDDDSQGDPPAGPVTGPEDDDDDSDSGPKPYPDPPRDKSTASNVNIYAFLVGINEYHDGPHSPPDLNGCLNDIMMVEQYLRRKYAPASSALSYTIATDDDGRKVLLDTPIEDVSEGTALPVNSDGRLHICTLRDRQATYQNIIRGFREFLSRATDKDSVFFHFSGHGSEQFSAREFLELDPNGRDQCLVCYKDKPESQLFLADKEIAVLLHELSKNKPHIVVSLDACHSGSGTRDILDDPDVRPRAYKFLASGDREDPSLLPGSVRPIDTYLDGYYKKQIDRDDPLDIPLAKHVLLSACESVQTAGDTSRGGVFTTSLLNTLYGTNAPIHYADLFTRTRSKASKKRNAQTPQFETIGGFNPYTCFLEGWGMDGVTDYYEVFRQGDAWYVRCGAVHGLPVGTKDKITLIITADQAENGNPPLMVGAEIEKVGAQHSLIKRTDEVKNLPDGSYFAEVVAMPAPAVYVALEGSQDAVDALEAEWDASKNVLIARDGEPAFIKIIARNDGNFVIRDAHTGRKFIEVPVEAGSRDRRIDLVRQNLEKIIRFQRMIELDNPNTKIRDLFDFELLVIDKNRETTAYRNKEVKIYGTPEILRRSARSGNDLLGINFRATLKSDQQDIFLYAFDLSSGCAIKFRNDEEKVMRVGNMNIGDTMPLRSAPYAWGLGPDDDEAFRYFKLIATTEELDYHQLTQTGLIGTKDAEEEEFAPEKISNDWCAETIKVTLIRAKNEIPDEGEAPAEMADGKIRIKAHADVHAKISLASADGGARSSDPANKLALFQNQGHKMLDFNTSRDLASQNVLELTNLQVDDPAVLQENPLEIVIADQLGEDELMLPIGFDGQNFRVLGDAVAEGDETLVRIRELPDVEKSDEENPFGEAPADRSLFKALKMAFFKLVLKKPDQNKLCYADYQEDGTVIRKDDDTLATKVAAANNILLAVHGIIGDTEQMAADLAFIKGPDGKSMKDHFDLVLTYDYENLTTRIETTAGNLKKALAEAGIKAGDGKKLTILAHSMGGLVSRWFIERLDGNQVVDHLILAGTPNNGSNFGKIEGARRFATTALDIAANFAPNLIPFSGYLIKGLQKTANLLVTLGQMDPDAKPLEGEELNFLQKLNDSPDPGISYSILGGDVTEFVNNQNGNAKGIDKLLKGVGNLANTSDKNDIAVKLDSILNKAAWQGRIPEPVTSWTSCHHLNYFSSDSGRKALGALLK